MHTNHLSLVPSVAPKDEHAPPLVQITTDRRKLFWRAFLTWQATATAEELEQFERVMAEHAHHVRPLMDAITEAMRLRETALRLPLTLLAELHSSGWRPVFAMAPVAFPTNAPREGWHIVA